MVTCYACGTRQEPRTIALAQGRLMVPCEDCNTPLALTGFEVQWRPPSRRTSNLQTRTIPVRHRSVSGGDGSAAA